MHGSKEARMCKSKGAVTLVVVLCSSVTVNKKIIPQRKTQAESVVIFFSAPKGIGELAPHPDHELQSELENLHPWSRKHQ